MDVQMVVIVLGVISLAGALLVLAKRSRSSATERDEGLGSEGWKRSDHLAGTDLEGELTDRVWQPVTLRSPTASVVEEGSTHRPDPVDEIPGIRSIQVGEAFSPAAPVNRQDLFAGRSRQIDALIDTVFERGQHAVIYGERGVGKTSLATVMASVFGARGTKLAIRINCDAGDSFDTIWRKAIEEMDLAARFSRAGFPKELLRAIKAADMDANRSTTLTPRNVRRMMRMISSAVESVLFFDELERVEDPSVTTMFADTIKVLSDQEAAVTLVLIGVGDNMADLLAEHSLIERSITKIHMPRMSPDELNEIVRRGLSVLDMKVEDAALSLVILVSRGLPHFTHLISQLASREALDAGEREVETSHVEQAMARLIERSQDLQSAYDLAVSSLRETIYPQVVLAAAMAPTDNGGFFSAADVVAPLSSIMKRSYGIPAFARHLHALSETSRGATLTRKGVGHRHRFRFSNPLLQPFVLMTGLTSGTITAEQLDELSGPQTNI